MDSLYEQIFETQKWTGFSQKKRRRSQEDGMEDKVCMHTVYMSQSWREYELDL
jgi:hypothetical protein